MLRSTTKLLSRSLITSASAPALYTLARNISACCHGYDDIVNGCESRFSVRSNNFKFGPGVIEEVGADLKLYTQGSTHGNMKKKRILFFLDPHVSNLRWASIVKNSITSAGYDLVVYKDIDIEPFQHTFERATQFMKENGPFDAVVSMGGGSTMDTAKAGLLYSSAPPPDNNFLHYINAPVGKGALIPENIKLPTHIAIPTTAGTGSEATGIAICKLKSPGSCASSKTGIASPRLIPDMAIVDPLVAETLPPTVVASTGFDVLCHAIESFTAKPYSKRLAGPTFRPLSQGRNPYSDIACREALGICGRFFRRAITDPDDVEARHNMMWASTIVGTAMGNAGVHLPHGLSYPVAGSSKTFVPENDYGSKPLVPHGMGVAICAPAVFRKTAPTDFERHMTTANLINADSKTSKLDDAGDILAEEIVKLLKLSKFPRGLNEIGFTNNNNDEDLKNLAADCFLQKRIVGNAPLDVTEEDLFDMYKDSYVLW